jgi:TPR repeat protein
MTFYWFEKAANNENVEGMVQLGYCYRYGKGVENDINKSITGIKNLLNKDTIML